MANDNQAIKLLILDDSQNNAERMVSLLRNAGHATRAHRVTSIEDLQECLQQNWDICLAQTETSYMTAEDAITLIKRQSRDIPFILLKPEIDLEMRTEALRSGMTDAVPHDADVLLTLIVDRELANLNARRQRRIVEQTLREAEKRC